MRHIAGAVLLALSIATLAVAQSQPADLRDEQRPNIGSLAEGCVSTQMFCDMPVIGTLKPGDCTVSSGAYIDAFRFNGVAGTVVEVTLRPISSSLTQPVLTMFPPASNASKTPAVFGGGAGTLWYLLSSSGTWTVGVSSTDLFATGDYLILIKCYGVEPIDQTQNCVLQELLCNQTALWDLTSTSCRFTGSNKLYAEYRIYGRVGDLLSLSAVSSDFNAYVAIYGPDGGRALAVGSYPSSRESHLAFRAPFSGFFDVLVSSIEDFGVGTFTVNAKCSVSGCLAPIIFVQPSNQTVRPGQRATLSVKYSADQSTTTEWYEGAPIDFSELSKLVGTGTSIAVPPATKSTSYFARISNPCGVAYSAVASVLVDLPRKRAAGRK